MSLRIYNISLTFLVALSVLISCSSNDKNESSKADSQMRFAVVDSLLGETVQFDESGQKFTLPKGFVLLPDSIRQLAQKTTKFLTDDSAGTVHIYLNRARGSGIVVSMLADLNLNSDTSKFLVDYYEALRKIRSEDEITVGDYWINDVLVKNFLVTDSQQVMFDLICLSEQRNAMHLQFLVPRQYYTEMIRKLESSIGSISTIK